MVEQPLLGLFARQAVAVGVQKALLGGQDRSRTVPVDRAAFEHPIGLLKRQARLLREALADVLIALEIIFPAPAVEAESAGAALLAAAEDDRPGVAQPDVAERLDDDRRKWAQAPRCLGRAIVGRHKPHRFALAAGMDCFSERRHFAPGWLQIAEPQLGA